jgi:hypothetical protein
MFKKGIKKYQNKLIWLIFSALELRELYISRQTKTSFSLSFYSGIMKVNLTKGH